jgi:hypothetical protein
MAMNLKEILETAAHLQKEKADAFQRGIIAALEELKEVYGAGIEETDLWKEYMKKENN